LLLLLDYINRKVFKGVLGYVFKMKNKTLSRIIRGTVITIGVSMACSALIANGFILGRASKRIPQTNVDIFRINNQAYMVRIYNPKEEGRKGLEITDKNNAADYNFIGTDEYNSISAFEERNPHIDVFISDTDK